MSDAAESIGGNWPAVFVFVFFCIFMRRVGSKERGTGLSDASESVGGNLLAGGLVGGMRVGPACSLLTRGQLVKMHTREKSNKCNQCCHASSPMNSFKAGKQVDL